MSKNFIAGIFLLVLILAMLWMMESQEKNIQEDNVILEKNELENY